MDIISGKSSKVLPKIVFAELPETYTLSTDELKFYDDNGYLVLPELIDFASIYSYKQRFIQICKGLVETGYMAVVKEPSLLKAGAKGEDLVNKLQDILFDDVLGTYMEHTRLLHVVSQMVGDHLTAMHSMLINKPPGTSRHPPHQDLYYFPFRPAEKIVAAWTAIDHVTLDNGCLYVLPGSHKQGVLHEHGDTLQDMKKLYHGILREDELAPVGQRVHLEMNPGDTVFFHPLLVHGSGPNISKNYRKAISCHFANSSCHYVNVRGTVQEQLATEIEAEGRKRGFELTFQELWRFRSKQVKGVRSNL